jgi:hypothetical protein
MKRTLEITLCLIVLAAIAFFGWQAFFEANTNNAPSKEAVAMMHHDIALYATKDDVTSIYKKYKTERNTIRTDMFQDTWEICMPIEFGASDWTLYVQYNTQNLVSAVAMRKSDGLHRRPDGSPKDKGHFGIPKGSIKD